MKSFFTAEFFKSNRKRLRTLCPDNDLIVITANALLQRNGDNTYHFRQDSSFWYLTGVETNEAILVIHKNQEFIILPDQHNYQRIFEGTIMEEDIKSRSGIVEVLNEVEGWKKLRNLLERAKSYATLSPAPAYIDFYKFYSNPARATLLSKIKDINDRLELVDIRPQITNMRMVKQEAELKTLKKVIRITNSTLKNIKENLSGYKYEFEIEADLTLGFRRQGAHGHAFHPIVAGGQNACTLHYYANSGSMQDVRFVLLDVGAELDNYAADISDTYWLVEPTNREAKVYNSVLETQAYAYGLLRPGVLIKEYEKQVEQFMGEKLVRLGLIDTIDRESVRKYFPHATSHHLGLDAHDVADYERPLEPGMVLTVEPGIYIPEEGIGVRIEDDVLITNKGCEVLSGDLTRSL